LQERSRTLSSFLVRVYFPNLARHFAYQAQIEYAGRLNLDKFAYHHVAQPQRRYSSRLVCTYLTTYLTQIMQHFDRTQSIFSKFSETFPLLGPDRICWPCVVCRAEKTQRLGDGEVRCAPRHIRRAWFCTRSSMRR